MKRFTGLILLLLVLLQGCASRREYVVTGGPAQGGAYSLKMCASEADLGVAELSAGVDSILRAVDRSVSGYNPGSLLTRFNAGEEVRLDSVFSDLYRISRWIWRHSEGAVDVAAGPVFDLWGFGFTKDSLPSDSSVQAALAKSGMRLLPETLGEISPGERPKLNFNCIAQGYSCDLIAEYLFSHGVTDFLVNVGGEIYCSGVNPSGKAWTVGIDKPSDDNVVSGGELQGLYRAENAPCGIVTSGNYRKFYLRDGRKYSHTVDPRSGYPVEHNLLSATLVASSAAYADAMATACMVVGLEKSKEFILGEEGLEGCLVYDEDGEMRVWTSPGFRLDGE